MNSPVFKPIPNLNYLLILPVRILLVFIVLVIFAFSARAQTYVFAQLQGAPVNTSGWNLQGSAAVTNVKSTNNSEILLCPALNYQSGAIFCDKPINLTLCNKWIAEFDFRIYDGNGADGIAFCFLDVPPVGFVVGGGMGIPGSANGLKVCFDQYPNCSPDYVPKIEIRYGVGYDECWAQPTFDNSTGTMGFIRSDTYNHAKITYDSGNISVYVNNTLYLTGFQQFTFSGYMGFTASTGGYTDNHSIKNVTIYTNVPPSVAGTAKEICSGASTQLGTTPDPKNAYYWSPATGLSATNVANPTVSLVNNTNAKIVQQYTVQTSFADNTGCSSNAVVTVTVDPVPVLTVKASANPVCAGTPVTFTATAGNSDPASTYLWYKNNVSTGVSTPTYTDKALKNNDQVKCTLVTPVQCSTVSNVITMGVNNYVAPTIAISTPATLVCPGTAVLFKASTEHKGAAPVFQWKINNINVGTNDSTFTTSTLNNKDVVSCLLSSSASCAVPLSLSSNSITMQLVPPQQPTASITASAATVCKGTAVTFAMKVSNGVAGSYQWKVNGSPVGTDSTFTSSTLADQDKISCDVSAATTCTSGIALSGSVTINVTAPYVPTISISSSANLVCPGTPVIFKASTEHKGAAPLFQWKINNTIAGTNDSTFTTGTLNNNDVVSCTLTSSISCVAPASLSSNSITINLIPAQQPKAGIAASANNICSGTPVTFSMPVSDGSAAGYQWKVNGVAASTDSVYTTATLADQDKISCTVTANTTCNTGIPITDSFIITVKSIVAASVTIKPSDNGVCPGVPVTFTATALNAGNSVNYQWLVNNNNAGTNSNTFTSTTLANNDVVTCQISPQNVDCLLQQTTLSNPYQVSILPSPAVTLPATQTITAGDKIVLSPVITSGDVATYTWSPTTGLSDASAADPVASPIFNTVYTLTAVSAAGCPTTATTALVVLRQKIKVVNTFTPNGDSFNDTWLIPDLENYPACLVDVYNRYGTKVFHSVGYAQAWDGKCNSQPVPVGVYYYVIDLKDGSKPVGGEVTVIR